MKFNGTISLFALVGSIALAQPASAAVQPPILVLVKVECQVINGQTHTVRTTTLKNGIAVDKNQFSFKNVTSGQTVSFLAYAEATVNTFPVPKGTYILTVSRMVGAVPVPAPGVSQALYNNIVVPATVSTGGRGTGCAFENPMNSTAPIAGAVQ